MAKTTTQKVFTPKTKIKLTRSRYNPIIVPSRYKWEARTYNPAAILIGDKIHILYRAETSFGYAATLDGEKIIERLARPVYSTHKRYDNSKGYPGAEDPRVVEIGDRIYMTYTHFEGDFGSMKMALTSIKTKDFLKKKWNWKKEVLMTRPGERHKNIMLFPEKIKNKFAILHKISPKVEIKYVPDIDKYFNGKRFMRSVYKRHTRRGMWDTWVRGAGPPPIRTELGWLLLYHAIEEKEPWRFKVGAMILDLKDPTKILYRAQNPILAPDKPYENRTIRKGGKGKSGVVYVSGAVVKEGTLYVYYGGADAVVCMAKIKIPALLSSLQKQDAEFKNFKKIKKK